MNLHPDDFPTPLDTIAEIHQQDPAGAIDRLDDYLVQEPGDAIAHFLMARFLHAAGLQREAVESAWKARIHAPGSLFFEKLPYFITHPRGFEAFNPHSLPEPPQKGKVEESVTEGQRPLPSIIDLADLDKMIDSLNQIQDPAIRLSEQEALASAEDEITNQLIEASEQVGDIATETLAGIYEKQGHIQEAINVYKRLLILKETGRERYESEIVRLSALL